MIKKVLESLLFWWKLKKKGIARVVRTKNSLGILFFSEYDLKQGIELGRGGGGKG